MLLCIEGFEGAASQGGGGAPIMGQVLARKGHYAICTIRSDAGRLGGVSIKNSNGAYFGLVYNTTDDTLIFGFGYKADTWPGGTATDNIVRVIDNDDNIHATIQAYGPDEWQVIVPEGTYTTSGESGAASTWFYIEFKITIAASGSFELRVNDVEVLFETGINTQANSDGTSHILNFSATNQYHWIDDLYLCDSIGSVNTDFLGNCQIVGVAPDGNGSTNDFVPFPGDNYENVDEIDTDNDSTYNTGDSGDIDYYTHVALAVIGVISGIQINNVVRATDAEHTAIRSKVKSNASIDTGVSRYISSSYSCEYEIVIVDPNTAVAWTLSGVNNAEFGLEAV